MSTPPTDLSEIALPTLDALGIQAVDLSKVDASRVAAEWLDQFAVALSSANINRTLQLITEDGFWRDFFSMTWEMRTFHTGDRIRTFLNDRLAWSKITNVQLSQRSDESPVLQRPYKDIAWLLVSFTFDTAVGKTSAIARLVPSPDLDLWRAHTIFTNLEELHGHPEMTGLLRERRHFSGTWSSIRAAEFEFRNEEPAVLIVGAGQMGLSLAARLKYLGIPSLVVEKNARVGDQWRERYEALCLQDTVWYDHMPYLPFPSGWPLWAPAEKLADWLESYAKILDINVWTGSNVTQTYWNAEKREWTITVTRNGQQRVFKPRHVVSAIGLAAGVPNVPHFPGEDKFKGKILHSTSFKAGRDYQGKKVLVVGTATSGHDISADLYTAGVDVTMLQRSSTYVMSADNGFRIMHKEIFNENGPGPDRSDRLFNASPTYFLEPLLRRVTAEIKEADADMLAGLRKVGFQLDDGYRGSGLWINVLRRGGGYYLDVGASELVAAGKIKLITGTEVASFTETGVEFADGRTLECDTVVYATGFGDYRDAISKIFGMEVASKLGDMWGLNEEGEVNGVWRITSGHPGLYVIMGNLALSRFHSGHMALQIKAMEVGVYSEPYLK